MRHPKSPLQRFLATTLAAVLVALSPGCQAYAQIVRIKTSSVNTAIGGARVSGFSTTPGAFGADIKTGVSLETGLIPSLKTTPSAPTIRTYSESLPVSSLESLSAPKSLEGPADSEKSAPITENAGIKTTVPAGEPVAEVAPAGETAVAAADAPAEGTASKGGILSGFSATITRHISVLKKAFAAHKDPRELPKGRSLDDSEGMASTALHKTSPEDTGLAPSGAGRRSSADSEAKDEPPAPPAEGKTKVKKGFFSLGRSAVFFILAMVVAQVGVESLGSAMPALVQEVFKDFTIVAELAIFGSIASIIGQAFAPLIIKKFGLKWSYIGGETAHAAAVGLMAFLLAKGWMILPVMGLFYAIKGMIGGVSATAHSSIGPALFADHEDKPQVFQSKLEQFWTWQQLLLEMVAVPAPILTAWVVTSMGLMTPLIAFPVAYAIAIAILVMTLKIPKQALARLEKDEKPAAAGGKPESTGFFAKIKRGASIVWNDKLLRTAFLAFTAFMILNPFLYAIIAPAFGMMITGGVATLAPSVYTLLTALYSFGGLLAALIMIKGNREIEKLKTADPKTGRKAISDAQALAMQRKSLLSWMKWGTFGLLAVASMAIPIPMLGSLIPALAGIPVLQYLTLPALLLIPFGIAQVISTIKLKTFFQANVPDKKNNMADVMGFFGAASLAVSTLGLLTLKFLFKGTLPFGFKPLAGFAGLTGLTPFIVIAAALVPLAVYYVYVTRRLKQLTEPAEETRD